MTILLLALQYKGIGRWSVPHARLAEAGQTTYHKTVVIISLRGTDHNGALDTYRKTFTHREINLTASSQLQEMLRLACAHRRTLNPLVTPPDS